MSDIPSDEFVVTTTPPPSAHKGGPGRPRQNPFDEHLRRSYAERYWEQVTDENPEGLWVVVPRHMVEERGVTKIVDQIRASGQHCDVGTEVRKDVNTLTVAFRGVPKVPRPRGNHPEVNNGEATADAVNPSEVYA